jgi:hypothetical protein
MKHIIALIISVMVSSPIWAAQTTTPKIDGLWEVRYDASNTPSAHIRIKTEKNGELVGHIEDAFPRPGEKAVPYCTKCTGANKDKPIKGLTVLWGMMPTGKNTWTKGHVLNAETGKVYSGKMTLSDDGKSLDLRGYILTPMLGDTSTWHRIK